MALVGKFVSELQDICATGGTRVDIYRPIQDLMRSLEANVVVSRDLAVSEIGGPDLFVRDSKVAIGYIFLADSDVKLGSLHGSESRRRGNLQAGLGNFIHTNGLSWRFYRNGQRIASVIIAELGEGFKARPKAYAALERHLRDFAHYRPETINCPQHIARRMGGFVSIFKVGLSNILERAKKTPSDLANLITFLPQRFGQTIAPYLFVQAYSEAIALSMFAARLENEECATFSWDNFLESSAESDPLMKGFFHIVGDQKLDPVISWIIDDYLGFLRSLDRAALLTALFPLGNKPSTFIEFYENFIQIAQGYEQKASGIRDTPSPLANFLARAVDEVLRCEFGLAEGLADTSRVSVNWDSGQTDPEGRSVLVKKELHRVQILDPYAGPGTCLVEVVKEIARGKAKDNNLGSNYAEREVLPRLNGFVDEPGVFSIARLRLGLALKELGLPLLKSDLNSALHLADALKPHGAAVEDQPYAQILRQELGQFIRTDGEGPIFCLIGTPPQHGRNTDSNAWILKLFQDYIIEPGSGGRLVPTYPIRITDDAIKFIRFAEHLVEASGNGIMAFATNHAFLHYPNYRVMRQHLLKTFDKLYVLDLYGNPNKKEPMLAGEKARSVFDTGQGVAVIIGVKTRAKAEEENMAKVFLGEVLGSKAKKLMALSAATLSSSLFSPVEISGPDFFLHIHHPNNA